MLTLRIHVPPPPNLEVEDIFSSALTTLFTDYTQNSHGTPGQHVIYRSPRFGDLRIDIPVHPDVDTGRTLFAHYLWNAAIVAAEGLERADGGRDEDGEVQGRWRPNGWWGVKGRKVLEVGAGTALPSLLCSLLGAFLTIATDHPSAPSITSDTIAHNISYLTTPPPSNSLTSDVSPPTPQSTSTATPSAKPSHAVSPISAAGYVWGTPHLTSTTSYGKLLSDAPAHASFDRIILADTLWMRDQHANLAKSILIWLKNSPSAPRSSTDEDMSLTSASTGDEACALVVAGFHTGRAMVAHFFSVATGSEWGDGAYEPGDWQESLDAREEEEPVPQSERDGIAEVKGRLRAAEIYEVDVECVRREWDPVRKGETRDEARRWCVVAVLVRR